MAEETPAGPQEPPAVGPGDAVPISALQRVGRWFRWLGKAIWKGTGEEEPPPPELTSEEIEAIWAKGEIPPPEFPNTRFGRFDRRFTAFTKWWSYLAGIGLLAIVVVLVIDVLGWKLFKHPFPSAQDFVMYMNVVAVFFAIAYIQTDRGSTAIELFQKNFPRWLKVSVRTLTWVLGMAVCFYCAYRGAYLVDGHLDRIKRATGTWKFVVWPFSMAMVIGFILLGLSFIVTGIRDLIEFRDRRARYGTRRKPRKKADANPAASE
jgi:TRAP-type C4-dicarboxylate transport system permease small subunit